MQNKKEKRKWPLHGNQHIIDFLEKSIKNQKLTSSYIFLGPDNLGKATLAKFFAQILLCQKRVNDSSEACLLCSSCLKFQKNQEEDLALHGDFHLLKKDKDKKNIGISEIREFIRKLSMTSMMGSYKVGIIKHADLLSLEASNALLKTLEEPRKKVLMILVASSVEQIPSTIVSRSQVLNFRPCPTGTIHDFLVEDFQLPRSQAKNYSRISLGRPALAVKFFEDEEFRDFYKTRMVAFVNYFKKDINRRLESLALVFSSDFKGQVAVKKAERILEIWQGLLRDFLLQKYSLPNLMQHEIIKNEIEIISHRLTSKKILADLATVEKARKNLLSNVNPRTVLENVVINIG